VDTVVAIAEQTGPIHCNKAPLQVLPNHTFDDHPPLDVVLVPGGAGIRSEENNPAVIEWIRNVAAGADWVTSVCTGAGLLHAAGPARGRRVATTGSSRTSSKPAVTSPSSATPAMWWTAT
jgi:putative intracellular protease/amidase